MDLQALLKQTDALQWILLGAFFGSFLIQVYFYLGIYLRLGRHRNDELPASTEGVSLLICARNEAENLERFLPAFLTQDYPKYEVVVVNDRSTDHSEEVLGRLAQLYPHLRFTSLPASDAPLKAGKKLALTVGLKSARFERILLSDADCYPASDQWLRRMSSRLEGEKEIVLGYGAYERHRGLLNLLIRYETVFTAMQYLGMALMGKAYMGVGRNLGYRKSLFFNGKGFSSHYHVPSGDDDLFVNEHAGAGNTAIEIDPASHTFSIPKERWAEWLRQKQRHLGAGRLYKASSRAILALEIFSRLLHYGLFIYLVSYTSWAWPLTALFLLFQLTRSWVFKLGMMRLNEKYLLLPSLLFDPLLPLALGIIWLRGRSKIKHQQWS